MGQGIKSEKINKGVLRRKDMLMTQASDSDQETTRKTKPLGS